MDRMPRAKAVPKPSGLPEALEPELATLVAKPQPGEWLYELKFDGYRMLARVDGRDIRVMTRRGNDWTARFPALVRELRRAKLPDGWYDGEIVVLDERGQPNFNALQNAIEGDGNAGIVFYVFDAPFLGGEDLRAAPVEERRARLAAVLPDNAALRFSQELPGNGRDLLASACRIGLEGIIGKRRGSPYVHRRSADWIKLKCALRQEFVIGGYTWPDNSRIGIGALLVGYYDAEGRLQYAGKVGTGFSGEMLARLRRGLDEITQPTRPFAGPTGHDRRATWVQPLRVCEVEYREWPAQGSLRHASFKGLREDKAAGEVRREQEAVDAAAAPAPPAPTAPAKAASRKRASAKSVTVTHGDRVLDPATRLTKLDLVRYYAEVSDWALPHLRGRHIFIRRAPAGVDEPTVFQEHPLGMKGLRGTDPALWPGHEPAISIETAEDLVAAAQAGMVELHTWNSTADAIDLADRLVLDIDPGQDVPWGRVREAAVLTRTMFAELGLESWLKTSGGKGLHVVVPLRPEYSHAEVKRFARKLVEHMARTIPQRFVAKSGASNRVGRIFLDYLRNGPSQTTAAAFSARTRPGLGVSMPIAWQELDEVAAGDEWNIRTALDRMRGLRKDPWAGYWKSRQSMREALARLG